MRLPEQRLWDNIRDAASGTRILLERIENRVGEGTPDVHALHKGLVTWCELKVVSELPVNVARFPALGAKNGLRQSQKNWHLDWQRHGGRSCIIVKAAGSIFTISGRFADAVNEAPFHLLSQMASGGTANILNALAILRGETEL